MANPWQTGYLPPKRAARKKAPAKPPGMPLPPAGDPLGDFVRNHYGPAAAEAAYAKLRGAGFNAMPSADTDALSAHVRSNYAPRLWESAYAKLSKAGYRPPGAELFGLDPAVKDQISQFDRTTAAQGDRISAAYANLAGQASGFADTQTQRLGALGALFGAGLSAPSTSTAIGPWGSTVTATPNPAGTTGYASTAVDAARLGALNQAAMATNTASLMPTVVAGAGQSALQQFQAAQAATRAEALGTARTAQAERESAAAKQAYEMKQDAISNALDVRRMNLGLFGSLQNAQPGGYAPGTTAPPGYVAVPRSDGGTDFVPDVVAREELDRQTAAQKERKKAAAAKRKPPTIAQRASALKWARKAAVGVPGEQKYEVQVPKLDSKGRQVRDEQGNPVMKTETRTDRWIDKFSYDEIINELMTMGFDKVESRKIAAQAGARITSEVG